MTIDEAISHALEVAERQEFLSTRNHGYCEEKRNVEAREQCEQCAADHRQLAEWLRELVGAKRLLKAAVDGFKFLGAWMDDQGDCTLECTYCPLHRTGINCHCWNKQDAALALIGEDGDTE